MWNKINSPIVITIIAVASLFVLNTTMKPKLASEVRSVYQELNTIEDSASDAEKSKAIQNFVQEIGTQIREGFAAGFKSNDPQKENKNKTYVATKDKINISGINFVKSGWTGREKFIFVVKNNSDKCVSSLKLNYEFYKKGELIDCKNEWLSQIKILEPNQEIAISEVRSLPKEEADNYKSDQVEVKITSFDIIEYE